MDGLTGNTCTSFNVDVSTVTSELLSFVPLADVLPKSASITEDAADAYCDCALAEIKEIVPNPHHVMSLTQEELDHILNKCKP